MHTETAKMIYPTDATAAQIAEMLSTTENKKFTVIRVTTGWQVCPVNVCQSAMPPWPPLPFKTKPLKTTSTTASVSKAEAPKTNEAPAGEIVVVKMNVKSNSPKYITVLTADGAEKSFGKSTLIEWAFDDASLTVSIKMPKAMAKKREVLDYIV